VPVSERGVPVGWETKVAGQTLVLQDSKF